jgi:two-component system response regulator HupR/HoxA
MQALIIDDEPELSGHSEAIIKVMKQVGRVAATNLPVMLNGESGTGKEAVARALHRRSSRAQKPFVAVSCGAIPTELIESELFGHQSASVTNADRDRIGLWEDAQGGTIFLDEITETTPAFQVKLLRALQQGEIRPVGSNRTQCVEVRVIAGSNRDLEEEVKARRFPRRLVLPAERSFACVTATARTEGRHFPAGTELCSKSLFAQQ